MKNLLVIIVLKRSSDVSIVFSLQSMKHKKGHTSRQIHAVTLITTEAVFLGCKINFMMTIDEMEWRMCFLYLGVIVRRVEERGKKNRVE